MDAGYCIEGTDRPAVFQDLRGERYDSRLAVDLPASATVAYLEHDWVASAFDVASIGHETVFVKAVDGNRIEVVRGFCYPNAATCPDVSRHPAGTRVRLWYTLPGWMVARYGFGGSGE